MESDVRLQWSPWFRCESSFSLLLVPPQPGLYALAEEVSAPVAASGDAIPGRASGPVATKRLLAVIEIDSADDLARSLSRLFLPGQPLRERLVGARCFVRYAVVPDAEQRASAAVALATWMRNQAETATGLPSLPEIALPDRAPLAAAATGSAGSRFDRAPAPLPDLD